MKPLHEYINEMLVRNVNSDGTEIIYAERNDIDFASITEKEFAELLETDAKEAYDSYRTNHKVMDRIMRNRERYIEGQMRAAKLYAEKKWKTEKKREEYLNGLEKQLTASAAQRFDGRDNGVIFTLIENTGNSHHACARINPMQINRAYLEDCLDVIRKSKWWKGATGWKFTLHEFKDYPNYSGLYIEPISKSFDFETYNAEQKKSDEAIGQFYDELDYKGD